MAKPRTRKNYLLGPVEMSEFWGPPAGSLRKWSYVEDNTNWRKGFYKTLHDLVVAAVARGYYSAEELLEALKDGELEQGEGK